MLCLHGRAQASDYSAAVRQLQAAARAEMAEYKIGGIAVALVDDQETVYGDGFGEAKRDSVFRCGSISKLFTAVAIMQLVEKGAIDLDAPVERYGRGLLPVNPFTNGAVTLRQILCHRSGMIRESPVGSYFDNSEPGLDRTVASITPAVLATPPLARTRYSNVGPSIAGRVIELTANTSFPEYQRKNLLAPLGMTNSAWLRKEVPRGRLIASYMGVADGRGSFIRKPAPVFDLGTISAGNLFTAVDDLAQFVAMLAARGQCPAGRILKPESLEQMFTPQLTSENAGFGIGFMVGKFRDHKIVSHNGAVYGHSSSLVFLPDSKIGVVVMGNQDIVNARLQKLANLALSLMLEAKFGEKPPSTPAPVSLSPAALAEFCGEFESQSYWAALSLKDGRLVANLSGVPTRLTPVEPIRFLADSRMHDAAAVVFERDPSGRIIGFTLGVQKFKRVSPDVPELPREWRAYLGSYGPSFIPLIITTRHGRLYAMTENMVDYRLTPLNRQVFLFPPGLYVDEHLVFLTDRRGSPHSVNLANMILRRR